YLRTWSRWEIRPKSYDRSDHLPYTRRSAPRCGAAGEPGQGPGRTLVSGRGSAFPGVTAGAAAAGGGAGARQLGVTAPEQVARRAPGATPAGRASTELVVRAGCRGRKGSCRANTVRVMSGSVAAPRCRREPCACTSVGAKLSGAREQKPVYPANQT